MSKLFKWEDYNVDKVYCCCVNGVDITCIVFDDDKYHIDDSFQNGFGSLFRGNAVHDTIEQAKKLVEERFRNWLLETYRKQQVNYTPDNITYLNTNQIFVFGSNTEGRHASDAARTALMFGAVYGQGRGLQGKTYAIVTKDLSIGIRSVSLLSIQNEIEKLYDFALNNTKYEFLVTKIGCGLAGYTISEIASLFNEIHAIRSKPNNIILPKEFSI